MGAQACLKTPAPEVKSLACGMWGSIHFTFRSATPLQGRLTQAMAPLLNRNREVFGGTLRTNSSDEHYRGVTLWDRSKS